MDRIWQLEEKIRKAINDHKEEKERLKQQQLSEIRGYMNQKRKHL